MNIKENNLCKKNIKESNGFDEQKNKKITNIFQFIVFFMLVIQPVLDLYWIYNSHLKILDFNIATFIRIFLVLCLIFVSAFIIKFKNKFKYFIIYFMLVIIYFFFHHYNAMNFNSLVPNNFSYNWLEEAFYLIRLGIPLLIAFIIYYIKIEKKVINYIIYFICAFFSLTIIFGNLFKISFITYGDVQNTGNIIDWFINPGKYLYNNLSSKGFFFSSWVCASLILLAPYMYYRFIKTNKWYYYLLLFCITLAMFIVGVKSTTYAVFLINIIMLCLYLFFILLKKIKINYCILIFLIFLNFLCFFIYPYCPAVKRTYFDNNLSKELEENKYPEVVEGKKNIEEIIISYPSFDNLDSSGRDTLINYFNKFYMDLGINKDYINKKYPYKYDPVFWANYIKTVPVSDRYINRELQVKIYNRIKKINNNSLDNLLGITFSRGSKIVTIEQDFVYQYYTIGLFGGILFLGPYLIVVIYSVITMLTKFNKNVNLENCSILLGIFLTLCISFYSGNILDTLGVTIILGFMCGLLLRRLNFK